MIQLGKYDEARIVIEEGLLLDPSNADLLKAKSQVNEAKESKSGSSSEAKDGKHEAKGHKRESKDEKHEARESKRDSKEAKQAQQSQSKKS